MSPRGARTGRKGDATTRGGLTASSRDGLIGRRRATTSRGTPRDGLACLWGGRTARRGSPRICRPRRYVDITRQPHSHRTRDGVIAQSSCAPRDHQQKTACLADLADTAADGSATWITAWGQRITIPPRPFLHDPAVHPPAGGPGAPGPGDEPDAPDKPPANPPEQDPAQHGPATSRAPAPDEGPCPSTVSLACLRPDLGRFEPLGLDLPCPPPF